MENFPVHEKNNWGDEANEKEILEKAPSFEEHMAERQEVEATSGDISVAFSEVMGEPSKEILESIDNIENKYDREYLVSTLPLFFEENYMTKKSQAQNTKPEIIRTSGLNLLDDIVNYVRDNGAEKVSDFVWEMQRKISKSDDVFDGELYEWTMEFMDDKKVVGNAIDREKENDHFEIEYAGKKYDFSPREKTTDCLIASMWAKDIVKGDSSTLIGNNPNGYLDVLKNSYIIDKLHDIANSDFSKPAYGSYLLIKTRIPEADAVEFIEQQALQDMKDFFYDEEEYQGYVHDVKPEMLDYYWASRLKEGFKRDRKIYAEYTESLERGNQIMQKCYYDKI